MDLDQLQIIDILWKLCSSVVILRHKCLHLEYKCEVKGVVKIFSVSLLESKPLPNLEDKIHFKGGRFVTP